MKSRNFWIWIGIGGLFILVVPVLSAIITATGAFGADPGRRVNRIDFVWAVIGLVITAYSFYRLRVTKS